MFLQNLFEIKIRAEISRLSSWVSSVTSKIQMFCYSQSILCAESERLGCNFQQFNCVYTYWSDLCCSLLLNFNDFSILYVSHPFVNRLNNLLVINLASQPLKSYLCTTFRFYFQLYFPKWFWNEFFNFFSLINTKTQSWRLARTICDN